MKQASRTRVALSLLPATAAAFLIGLCSQARADDQNPGRPCSNEVLKGSYGFYRAGMTPNGALAAIGTITFDGNGHSNVTQSISRGGEIDYDITFPGLHLIDATCRGKGMDTDGNEGLRIVVVDGGNSFYILSESNGNSVYGIGTRIKN